MRQLCRFIFQHLQLCRFNFAQEFSLYLDSYKMRGQGLEKSLEIAQVSALYIFFIINIQLCRVNFKNQKFIDSEDFKSLKSKNSTNLGLHQATDNEKHLGNKRGRQMSSSSLGGEMGGAGKGILSGKAKFQMLMSEIDTAPPEKSELHIYLTKSRYNCDVHANLDVIGWWKGERLRFKILSKMAVNILSIPFTSVASESTFNAGGRVIDARGWIPFRCYYVQVIGLEIFMA